MLQEKVQQESEHHSNESQQGMGPLLLQQSTQQYKKRLTSFLSVSSDSQDITNRCPDSYQQSQINIKLIKQKKSIRRFQTRNFQSPEQQRRQTTVKCSQDVLPESLQSGRNLLNKIKAQLIRNRYIRQFSQNLLLNSYVLPTSLKYWLQQEQYLQENQSQNIKSDQSTKSQYIFLPSSRFIFFVDSYFIIIQIISLWLGPLLSSFQQFQGDEVIISVIILFSYFLEILISLNKAIISQGDIISERKKIIQFYLQSQFYQDLIMIIVWLFYCLQLHQEYIINEFMVISSSLVNMKKLAQNYYNYVEYFYQKKGINNFIDLITLIILIFFYAHFMACLWHYIGNLQNIYEMTWLIKYNLIDLSMWTKYFYSFYWSTVTIATIGYGDITPQNNIEVIFCSIMILFSSCVYAYLMNSIGIILKQLNDTKFKQRMQTSLISQYMNKNQVNQNIQSRVKNYFKKNIINESLENKEVDNLISQLPETLRTEMIQEIQIILINKIKLLKQNFSNVMLQKLSKTLIRSKYAPGDLIFKQNDHHNQKLYFILNGKVDLIEINSKKLLHQVKENQCFNEYSFFTGFQPKFTAYCQEYTEVISIDRESIINILIAFQKDREKFHMIKDQILFDNKYDQINLKCNFCKKFNHQSIECQMIQYQPDLEQRLKKFFFKSVQDRIFFQRKQEKYNSLIAQQVVQESIQKYCQLKMDSDIDNPFSSLNSKDSISRNGLISNKLPQFESDKGVQRLSKTYIQQQLLDMNKMQCQSSINKNDQKQYPNHLFEQGTFVEIQLPQQLQHLQTKEESLIETALNSSNQFHSAIIDSMRNYKFYYPSQNATIVIKKCNNVNLNNYHQIGNFLAQYKQYGVYTFNINLIQKIIKSRTSIFK